MCVKFKPNIFPTTLKMNKYKWVYLSLEINYKNQIATFIIDVPHPINELRNRMNTKKKNCIRLGNKEMPHVHMCRSANAERSFPFGRTSSLF